MGGTVSDMAGVTVRNLLTAALVALCLYVTSASVPTRLYVVGLDRPQVTPPTGSVIISATTNAAGAIRIVSYLPPDHDWRFRIGRRYFGLTYYGSKVAQTYRGTWIVLPNLSLRVRSHIYVVATCIWALMTLAVGVGWKLARKEAYEAV